MEEQFVLRVPPSVAERLQSVLSENPEFPEDEAIDLSFSEDGRTGKFVIGEDEFEVSLVDLPCVVESYKTYDDTVLIKTADIGQMILVKDPDEPSPQESTTEYRHGLTPPMRDARRRRFRRQPDLNPDYVQQIEKDLQNIMAGGTARDVDVEVVEQEEEDYEDEPAAATAEEPKPTQEPSAAAAPLNPTENANAEADDSSSDEGEYYEDSDN